jgi:hypothetical protein
MGVKHKWLVVAELDRPAMAGDVLVLPAAFCASMGKAYRRLGNVLTAGVGKVLDLYAGADRIEELFGTDPKAGLERGPIDDLDGQAVDASFVRDFDVWADKVIPSIRITHPKYRKAIRLEAVGVQFAFKDIDVPPAAQDKIQLSTGFIAPILQAFSSGRRSQDVEN